MNDKPDRMPNVPPFVRFVASAVPMVFDNSLSYYEALCALWKYIQGMTDVINNNATLEEEYILKFNELKTFVDTYFDNLDVQEEINNKLDQMAEDGTLQEIIAQYLQSNVTWTFDSVADMKSATNLTDGSYAKTLGFYEAGDGGGATYLISDSGTADEKAVIAVGDLFATIVTGDVINVKQFGAKGDGETDDTSAIHTAINYAKTGNTVIFPTATYLCNIYCTKALHFDFKGSKLISYDNQSILSVNGSKSTNGYLLTSNLVRGDRTFSFLASGSIDLQAGDYILLRDDSERPHDGLRNINEEVHQIESISGTTIKIKDFVRYKKDVATSTANIYKLTMLKNISIENVELYDDNHDSSGIGINYCENVSIHNVKASNMANPAIFIVSSVDIEIYNVNLLEASSVDSGKGYGILLDHGTNYAHILDVKGYKQRHLIDCSSSFDVLVEHCVANNSQSSSFIFTHNSYGNDVTFKECVSDGGDWYGFGSGAQGVSNYYDITNYNLNLINCKSYPDNTTGNSIGCFYQCPVQDSVVENFEVNGRVRNTNGNGIRLRPINNKICITNLRVHKMYRAVFIEEEAIAENDELCYVKFIEGYIDNCQFAFRIGNLKEIYIDKFYTNATNTFLHIAAYSEEKVNPLKFLNITNCIFKSISNLVIINNDNYIPSTYTIGKINNINLNTAEGNYKVNVLDDSKILGDITSLFARCSNPEGIVVPIKTYRNNAVTLNSDFLINGLTVYQTVTIINYGDYTVNLPHSTKIQNAGGTTFALEAGKSTKYIWNGVNWHQVA